MDKSTLVRLIGFPATVLHGDPGLLDRWLWLRTRLPKTRNGEKIIDVGCGTGAFSIGAVLRGYEALGLSWNERNQRVVGERAGICKAYPASFEVLDVRDLGARQDLRARFDIALCLEAIEHVVDDRKLIQDIAACLKPGGRLYLTTPYLRNRPITSADKGPWSTFEDGGHVRGGYTPAMLRELCGQANLVPEEIPYGTGFISQKLTLIVRVLSKVRPLVGWAVALPLRIFQLVDRPISRVIGWPFFSIRLEAYKPRFNTPLGTGI